MRQIFAFSVSFLAVSSLFAQISFPKQATSDEREGCWAFTSATIYKAYNERLEGATLVIRNGKIETCAIGAAIPRDAAVVDCKGKTILPAFIDLWTNYGIADAKPILPKTGGQPQVFSNKKGAFAWNEALKPEFSAAAFFAFDQKTAEDFRKIGFGAVLSQQMDGISRGLAAFVNLGGTGREHEQILTEKAAHVLSFRKGVSTQDSPNSLMGCLALLRQTYLDGDFYKKEGFKTEVNLSLAAWNDAQNVPQLFEAGDRLDVLRIARLGKEFSKNYIVKTRGDEYARLEEVKKTGQPLIVPLNFPDAFDVEDPFSALQIELKDLKNWELAPTNPARLAEAGIPFCLTTAGLKERSTFFTQLKKAFDAGLLPEAALKALTFSPANFINNYGSVGSLDAGKKANFLICSAMLGDKDFKIFESWAGGNSLIINELAKKDLRGEYNLRVGKELFSLNVKGTADAPEMEILKTDSSKIKVKSTASNGTITLAFALDTLSKSQTLLSGTVGEREWSGRGTLPTGDWANWSATLKKPFDEKKVEPTKQKPIETPIFGEVTFPFTAFGWTKKPSAEFVLIKNATVWTGEKDGILEKTDVLLLNGKIQKIGKNLPPTNEMQVIDAAGKHLTAGIIDEHSHIAIARGVNEAAQESSAEVRIGDVLDSEDIDMYRQLAGGVTASHLLHGSANPIGGQTQLIKLKWGFAPEDLKVGGWPGYIKFALGENVKQANWGDNATTRFPQTRMGVEQVYDDYFTRAREYGNALKTGKTVRRDLELEALLEILERKRFITCHSYVQSEIIMLMRLAERHGFRIQTFTHILEGYKVADKMAKHGVGASSFSDWWDYKWEVYDAIPQNPAMLTRAGVTTAINSDDAEMARRLNQEAAKSVLFGGVSEEEAWKMVTINPAKLLQVDQKMGSIKVGKDADVVIWSENPLSVYSKAEVVFVDGIRFFDRKEDEKRRDEVRKERARLIQKMLKAKQNGAAGGEKGSAPKHYYHCDSEHDEG